MFRVLLSPIRFLVLMCLSLSAAYAKPISGLSSDIEKPSSPASQSKSAQVSKQTDDLAQSDAVSLATLTGLSTGLSTQQRPLHGPGTFRWADAGLAVIGSDGAEFLYSVGVEEGIKINESQLALFIEHLLRDPRGWSAHPTTQRRFKRVKRGGIKIVIASPSTVDKLCHPLITNGYLSCARNSYIAINLNRWEDGVFHWTTGLLSYRRYLINHEIGHWLWQTHVECPKKGELAPIMMQQSLRLNGCVPNGWPYPN